MTDKKEPEKVEKVFPDGIDEYMKLFSGRNDCYGYNKICLKEPLTKDIYDNHLTGVRRIGCYPIFNNTLVRWLAVDIDINDFEKALLFHSKFKHHGLESYIERSKSKGFHVWLFFNKEIDAVKPRLVVEMIMDEIDFSTEIFPKQDSVSDSGYGNFIFLPLFGGDTRHGKTCFINEQGEPFIKNASDLSKIKINDVSLIEEIIEINELKRSKTEMVTRHNGLGLPAAEGGKILPCIANMKRGVGPHQSNMACYRIASYYKQRGMFRDDIIDMLVIWDTKNTHSADSTFSLKEIETTVDSVWKSDYVGYGCEDPFVQEYCSMNDCPMASSKKRKQQINEGVITMTFRDERAMVFKKKDLEFRLQQFEFSKSGKFKCSITLSKDSTRVLRDTVNIGALSQRERFAKAVKIPEVADDLVLIEDLVRKQLDKEEKEKIEKKKQLYVMSEDEKQEAMNKLSQSPHILTEVIDITNRMGVVGEEDLRLMVYLCFTSRITDQPISITVKGEASSGKSYSCQNVMKLIPEEGVKFITRATAQAFYHMEEDGLQHKIVYINESPGQESADYSIRSAQSEGDLKLMIPVKDPVTGNQITQEKTVKGPAGFLTTTTKAAIFDENETRNFSVFSDDSPTLTRKIGQITVRRALGEDFDVASNELNLWKNMQRLLNPEFRILIPYAKEVFLAFPDKPVRIRRDRERFRTLIEVITLLHQFHRKQYKIKGGGVAIESTLADYYIAKIIAEDILTYTIFELGPSADELWKHIQEQEGNFNSTHPVGSDFDVYTFTYRDLADSIDWKKDKVKKWMAVLTKTALVEYSSKSEGGKNKESIFQVCQKNTQWSKDSNSFLPPVEDLYGKYTCDKNLFYNPMTGMKIDPIDTSMPEGLDDDFEDDCIELDGEINVI